MGWSWTTAAVGDDWQNAAFIAELYEAWNERRVAIWQAAVSVPAGGDYASHVNLFADLQYWIETNCTSFVQSHDLDGTPRAAGFFDGEVYADAYTRILNGTAPPWTWTIANLRAAAGLNASGFKRVTTGTTYGTAIAGDYVGSHLYNELRKCLDLLIWTFRFSGRGGATTYSRSGSGGTYAAALTSYAAASLVAQSSPRPEANAKYQFSLYFLYRQKTPVTVSSVPASISSATDWYCLPASHPLITFDAFGDGYTQNRMTLYQTDAAASTAARSSADLGNNGTSAAFAEPSTGDAGRGYILGSYAVLRWSFTHM